MKPKRLNKHSMPKMYRGVWYRSRLEVAWVAWFDRLGIKYIYEPDCFRINGIGYMPDFYLPEIRTAFEVKGYLDAIDQVKLGNFIPYAAKRGTTTIIGGNYVGNDIYICRPSPQAYFANPYVDPPTGLPIWDSPKLGFGEIDFSIPLTVCQCINCGKTYFCDSKLWHACQSCGWAQGNHNTGGFEHTSDWLDVWTPNWIDVCEDAQWLPQL